VKIDVIINAGSGAGIDERVRTLLAENLNADAINAQIHVAQSGAEITYLAEQAARSDAEIVVVGGGDGTLNSVAAHLIDTQKILGVLPLGTLNHFAKDLGIPLDLEQAVRTVLAGHIVNIDVGAINDRIFLNNSSLGLYPSMVHERKKVQRLGWGKWPAFIWAALLVLRRHPLLDVSLSTDGKTLTSRAPFVFIGNNEYEMETLNVGSRTCLDKGELSLYMTTDSSRLALVRLAVRVLLGGLRQEKDFLAMCTNEVWIGTKRRRIRVAMDGEVTVMEPPLHYKIRPRALRVFAPADS
jgi:YegS/Rv2252/BmrU family lipid kinase